MGDRVEKERQFRRRPEQQEGYVDEAALQKRAERRNRPSSIAHRLLESLVDIEASGTRFEGLQETIAFSVARCQSDGSTFMVDTITCPEYAISGSLGTFEDFSRVHGVGNGIEQGKFERYLVTLARTKQFLETLDTPIPVQGRAYFGDIGVIGVADIKEQLQLTSDEDVRQALAQTHTKRYEAYFAENRDRFKLDEHDIVFGKVTDIAPEVKSLPLDLHTLAEHAGLVEDSGFVGLNTALLRRQGVDEKIIRAAQHTAAQLSIGRAQEYGQKARALPTHLEVSGFLVAYGTAGKRLAEQPQKTDLFVSCDPPGNYRADFYYAFLGRKGENFAVITPDRVETLKERGVL